jgi:hypothetical protein
LTLRDALPPAAPRAREALAIKMQREAAEF